MNDKQIKALNKVIEAAVEHGGDPGGAYYCYPDELAEAMNKLVSSLGNDYYTVSYIYYYIYILPYLYHNHYTRHYLSLITYYMD